MRSDIESAHIHSSLSNPLEISSAPPHGRNTESLRNSPCYGSSAGTVSPRAFGELYIHASSASSVPLPELTDGSVLAAERASERARARAHCSGTFSRHESINDGDVGCNITSGWRHLPARPATPGGSDQQPNPRARAHWFGSPSFPPNGSLKSCHLGTRGTTQLSASRQHS